MIAVARFVKAHRGKVARTLRETFSVGLTDLGDGLSWGEALLLLSEAAQDPGTAIGAELAEWEFPASRMAVLTLSALVRDEQEFARVAPWAGRKAPRASDEELAAARAELEAEIVFSP